MSTTSIREHFRRFATLTVFAFILGNVAKAQVPVATKATPTASPCRINGADTVKAGATVSFTSHPCSLTNWSTTCGTVIAQTDSGVTIRFSSASCAKAVISAGTVSKNVTILPASSMVAASVTPSSQSIPYNSIPMTLRAGLAQGGLCDGVYTYQWYSSSDSVHFSKVTGATGKDYQPGLLIATTWFRRTDSCTLSGAIMSNVASVRVIPRPVASAVAKNSISPVKAGMLTPQNQSLTKDSLSALLSCVGFGGGNGHYTFSWDSSPDGSTWTPVAGVTTPGYNPGWISATTWFRVTVTSNNQSVTGTPAVIYLNSKQ
jgi:hypothetical protein